MKRTLAMVVSALALLAFAGLSSAQQQPYATDTHPPTIENQPGLNTGTPEKKVSKKKKTRKSKKTKRHHAAAGAAGTVGGTAGTAVAPGTSGAPASTGVPGQ
ncbi:MAG TPA: hypothetical protein VJ550_09110 [Geomonas sp.]|nr:hypothetical protein [Geomonas sp.]